jgi:8-amino-7-oxononanoate synthase
LGLSQDAQVLKAGINAASEYGNGATGSRLLSGNYALFKKLEKNIARDKKTSAALIFNSCFQCNISVLSSLLDQKNSR